MRALLRPRLSSLDVYASSLLLVLGVAPQLGCEATVSPGDEPADDNDGGDGQGASGAGTSQGAGSAQGGGSADGGWSSQGGGTATGGSSAQGGGPNAGLCEDPQPILVDGIDTGFDRCEGGQIRRREAVECPTSYPDENPCCGGCPDGSICNTNGEVACSCVDACTTDAECGPGNLCLCGDPAGICVPATCLTGHDCGAGQECTSFDPTQGCLYLEFACTTPADSCGGDADCVPPNSFCTMMADGHRECAPGGCAIGRPFLIDDEARTADIERRTDWCDGAVSLSTHQLDETLRGELARAWEHTARMEHASVAAFARFALDLLALGAPADLLARTHRAMADETKHARMAFAITSTYRGEDVGPGPLAMDGALDGAADVAVFVRRLVREGCVGETVAAIEADEAEASAIDPGVKNVLGVIANDESEHAQLAWRSLEWAVATFAQARSALEEEISILEGELAPAALRACDETDPREALLLKHGVVTPRGRARIRQAALRRAILPCLRSIAAVERRAAA